jgi:hypothetical protein
MYYKSRDDVKENYDIYTNQKPSNEMSTQSLVLIIVFALFLIFLIYKLTRMYS